MPRYNIMFINEEDTDLPITSKNKPRMKNEAYLTRRHNEKKTERRPREEVLCLTNGL